MNKLITKIVFIIALLIALTFSVKTCSIKTKENKRLNENFEQLQKNNHVLNLNLSEFKALSGKDKEKIESLLSELKLKPKQVKEVTVVNTVYRDTGSTKIIYKEVVKQLDGSYKIPVNYDSLCWGFKGEIQSKDSLSKFYVLEKSANNSIQLIVTKPKKFLFWTVKKEQFKAFSKCGEINFTNIKFVK